MQPPSFRDGPKRIGRHLMAHRWRVRRIFPPHVLAAIKASETAHTGQIRFVVEGAPDGAPLQLGRKAGHF